MSSEKDETSIVGFIVRGIAMGMAEMLPGISGGTIALVTGIYDRMVRALSEVPELIVSLIRHDGFNAGRFLSILAVLVPLGIGMAAGIALMVALLVQLLDSYPLLVWGLVFGVMAGAVLNTMTGSTVRNVYVFLPVGLVASSLLNQLPGSQGEAPLFIIFIGGALAFGAWIIPGISGAFVLLVLGIWATMLNALGTLQWIPIATFLFGLVSGWFIFAIPVRLMLEKYRPLVMALFSGLLLGSLWRIWPWRSDDFPVFPWTYENDPMLVLVVVAMCLGFGIVSIFTYHNVRKVR